MTRIPPVLRDTVPYVVPQPLKTVPLPPLPHRQYIGQRRHQGLLREPWVHVVLALCLVAFLLRWLGVEVRLP